MFDNILFLYGRQMYKYTRQDVADVLNISTRSVDRYIRSGKLRSKKDGKIIYIHNGDVDLLKNNGSNQEVIVPKKESHEKVTYEAPAAVHTKEVSSGNSNNAILSNIYEDLRNQIEKKDEMIQILSVKIGKAEEIAKNSISVVEFKKSQFLLEESKGHLSGEVDTLRRERAQLAKELHHEKNTTKFAIIFLLMILTVFGVFFFSKI